MANRGVVYFSKKFYAPTKVEPLFTGSAPVVNLDWLPVYPVTVSRKKPVQYNDNPDYIEFNAPPYSPTTDWLAVYPNRIDRRHTRRQDFNKPVFALETYPVPDLSWEGNYPNKINRRKLDVANTQNYSKQYNLSNLPVPDSSWIGTYPHRLYRRSLHVAHQQAFASNLDIQLALVPELSWLSEYPNRTHRKGIKPHLIPFEDRRNFIPILNPVPVYFHSENINPILRRPFYGYQYFALISFYSDTPIPFNANRKLLACVDETESWANHFLTRAWANIADQIAAGYPIYAQPSLTTASYEEVYDAGVIIQNTVITLQYSTTSVVGVIAVVIKLAVSDDGITYTPFNIGTTLFAASVRYIKFRFEFTTTGDKNLAVYFNINLNLSTKREMDGGTVDVLAADVGGTTVSFNKTFKDIETITVTPLSTVEQVAIYDFVDVPNPTTFKILLYDTAGVRIDGRVSWKARGVV